jgi:hypothetical protein
LGGAFKTVQVEQVIGFGCKYRLAVIAALDDMQWLTLGEKAGQARHGGG